jgi:hypothetical protein
MICIMLGSRYVKTSGVSGSDAVHDNQLLGGQSTSTHRCLPVITSIAQC